MLMDTRADAQGGSRETQQALPTEASILGPWCEVANRTRESMQEHLGSTCGCARECLGPRHGCTHRQVAMAPTSVRARVRARHGTPKKRAWRELAASMPRSWHKVAVKTRLSTTRPSFFDGTNYNYWKTKMKVFMLANVPKAWIVTMKGPYVPMKVVEEREVPKEEVEWNDEDLGKIMINNKAINMLQYALNPMEFHKVSGCDTAKEMWDMLEMKSKESIQDMYTRLNDIVTNLKALGKIYPSQEVVRKVFKSLPKNWEAKKTAIEESKDLNTLKLEDLIGKLMTYEIEVQVDGGVEVVEKKKKDVAFKASNQKEKSEDDASDGENISTLISREVRRFMKKNIKSKLAKRDEGESTKKSVKCYECNKMRHYRNECPKLKKGEKKGKKSMKKKAFAATWSDDETSSTESESSLEKGAANICFMAQEDSNHDDEQSDEEEGDADQEMAEQGDEEHGGDSLRPFEVSMQRTNRETMELMINEMRQLHTDFYGFRAEMRGRMDTMDGKLDQLVNNFFPPPLPSAT
ncbi:hypothetical protein SLEP1_g17494 [Rubroshorea leprosula]|uniref:CCHC-type domain-containing protein n=1 Tax=Rubroshorea leprosula TaxID=152421 RepID=A0AAV5J3D1_9ROSI|nr:hypothetical protein SLEP1_g17494 [Rubroshorea leprosula]